jgi:DNA-binding transcriptional MocR family regulator
MKRYQLLANEIEKMIVDGALKPGARVPSVRQAGNGYGVSASTVFQAYYVLEQRGLIVARPRSGYFVSSTFQRDAGARPGAIVPHHANGHIDSLVARFMRALYHCPRPALGAPTLGVEFFPVGRIARSMAAAVRDSARIDGIGWAQRADARLRRQIMLRYAVTGVAVSLDEIIITSGGLDALTLSLQALTRPGDTIAIGRPAPYVIQNAVRSLHLKSVEIPVDPIHGLNLEALENALRHHPVRAGCFMTTLQNPTGASLSDARKAALANLLAIHDVPLIEHDVYRDLHFHATPASPTKRFDTRGLVLHCGSFSKSLAPGFRVGWVAAGRFAATLERARAPTTISACVPAQIAIADYLESGAYDRFLRSLRRKLASLQARTTNAVIDHFPAGTKVNRPEGGHFLWVELPDGVDTVDLFEAACASGVVIAPGPLFSSDPEYRRYIRINYARSWSDDVIHELRIIGALAAQIGGRAPCG